ncbi:hypothetical protein [Adhaeribacter pallidiroseus]|uniref:Uncharacterized protein n=1 Tax=Adhaeribacter pallidiroseus TaxID=2072847 RepID=A0A369QGD0_9BACT|nr:hypothetical protein [Adhaeribacter pallidiroseus]RDC62286.1 hypothetical protein AHMF7616_00878 [Adhaeribacter pallidiroseus]
MHVSTLRSVKNFTDKFQRFTYQILPFSRPSISPLPGIYQICRVKFDVPMQVTCCYSDPAYHPTTGFFS